MVWNLEKPARAKHDHILQPSRMLKKRTEWQLLIIAVKGPVHDTFHPCPLGIISFFLVLVFLRGSTLCGPLGHPFLHDDGPLSHSQAAKCGYGY
jgi:hypothetical protein